MTTSHAFSLAGRQPGKARKTIRARGSTLLELTVSMVVLAIVVSTFMAMVEICFQLMNRAATQETVVMQIEPMRSVLNEVRHTRYELYDSLEAAQNRDISRLVPFAEYPGAGTFALRCTRRDGEGVFLIVFDSTQPGEDPAIYLAGGTQDGINLGNRFGPLIPFSRAFSFVRFDVSQGFLQMTLRTTVPMGGGYSTTANMGTRAEASSGRPGIGEIEFNLIAESSL